MMPDDVPLDWLEKSMDTLRREEARRWRMHVAVTHAFLEDIARSIPFQAPSADRRDEAGVVMAAIEEAAGVEDRDRRDALVVAETKKFVLLQAERYARRQSPGATNPRIVGVRTGHLPETIYTVEFDLPA